MLVAGQPYGPAYRYKAFSDYQAKAKKAYPAYPPMGGNGWRAQKRSIYSYNWDYDGTIGLESAKGMSLKLSLEHDTPFEGWLSTMTFYCTVQ